MVAWYVKSASYVHVEVALGEVAIADSLHNLQLILGFLERFIPVRCTHMTLNDLFYTHAQLKVALVVFLAELFYWLEVNPVPSVRDVTKVPYYLTDPDSENSTLLEYVHFIGCNFMSISGLTSVYFSCILLY